MPVSRCIRTSLPTASTGDQAATGVPRCDAVVHFAAVPATLIRPDNETFREDSHATSTVVNEPTARSFQPRSGIDIYALRRDIVLNER